MASYRNQKLNSQFQQEISAILQREMRDRCRDMSPVISVTEADVSPDLKSAKIYISIFDTNEERKKKSFEAICDNAGFIHAELFSRLHLRSIPTLRFIMDGSQEYGARINSILSKLDIPKEENDEDDKK